MSHERVRPLLSAGSSMVHGRASTTPCSRAALLLGRACQRLWLGIFDDVYQRFTCVGRTALPWPLTAWRSQIRLLLADPPTVAGRVVPGASRASSHWRVVTNSLRPGREQLVEQLVSSSHQHLLVRQRTNATFRSHGGGVCGSSRCCRMATTTGGSVRKERILMGPPHAGQSSGNTS